MNHPEDLESRFEEFKDEANHNITMLLGQAWKQNEQLRLLKNTMVGRFNKLDDRITEAHRDIAQLELDVKDIKANMATKDDIADMATKEDIATMATKDDITRLEKLILQLLQQNQG